MISRLELRLGDSGMWRPRTPRKTLPRSVANHLEDRGSLADSPDRNESEPARDIPLSRAGSVEAMWHHAGLTPTRVRVFRAPTLAAVDGANAKLKSTLAVRGDSGSSWPGWMLHGRLVASRI